MVDFDHDEEIRRRFRGLMPQEARSAYWQKRNGPMFMYNTERIRTPWPNDPANGKFESAVFEPYGLGSRSGKATRWRKVEGESSLHDLRKDAKARAYRLYEEWLQQQGESA